MNRTQTLAVAVLATLLPFAQAAFASDWEHADRGHGRPEHTRGHGYGQDHHGHRWHHYRHHNCRDDHRYHHYQSHYDHGGHASVTLPFPPLPPFPVIILNKKHHGGHIELRRQY